MTQVSWLAPGADNFALEADSALLAYMTTANGNTTINGFVTLLNANVTTTRASDYFDGPRKGDSDAILPLVLIATQEAAIDADETLSFNVTHTTRIMVFTEHADLNTARQDAMKYSHWIMALLVQDCNDTDGGDWTAFYHNAPEVLMPSLEPVDVDTTDPDANVHAAEIRFTWRHVVAL